MDNTKITAVVRDILANNTKARENDYILYAEVFKTYNHNLKNIKALSMLNNFAKYNVPNTKTVERIRRKLQLENEDLRPTAEIWAKRHRLSKEYAEAFGK